MLSFTNLIASRREWIDSVLLPWCKTASRRDLLLAEQNWTDLAGRPSPEMTLWLWAWSRFPDLCEPDMTTLNETWPVAVERRQGPVLTGYPDARKSLAGELILVTESGTPAPPISIDDIISIQRILS